MAQYDLLLTQNIAPAGIEFSEKYVNLPKGAILSGDAFGDPTVLAPGGNNTMLVRDDAESTGLKWVAQQTVHTQGTDQGTTSNVFELDTDGYKIELTAESASKFGVKVDGGATYADLQAKDATFNKVTVVAAPVAGTDLANKTYIDGILAANDAMIYKGTIGTAGTHTILAFNALTTYNAGWTYRMIEAGTVRGNVCEIGDLITVLVDRAGAGNLDADFTAIQTNIDGAVIGPASSVDNYVALFSGTSGKLLKAGTGALGTAAYTASTAYATAAQGTLATNAIPKVTITAADQIVYGSAASTPAVLTVGASTFVGKKATGTLSAMSVAEAKTLLAYGSAASNNTGDFATAAQGTLATNAIPKGTITAADQIVYGSAASTPAVLTVLASTFVGKKAAGNLSAMSVAEAKTLLAYGSAANNNTGDFATAAQGTLADNAVAKSLYDANSILAATTDNTPAVLAVAEQTLLGRKTGGGIAALASADIMNVIWVTAPALKTSTGVAGQIAKDANWFYICTATDVWKRSAIATNW